MRVYLLLALCGLSIASDNYIIKGNDVTEEGKWPWQGSIRPYGVHKCGIVLISPRKGLTTATCVNGYPLDKLEFMFGSTNRMDNTIVVHAHSITIHEDFNKGSGSYPNNIALVEFDKAIVGQHVEPIPITTKDRDHTKNRDCWLTGWGVKVNGRALPITLQEARMMVYSDSWCSGFWGDLMSDGHFCVGDSYKVTSSCTGDGGSPVACKVFGQYELVGLMSWGTVPCTPQKPYGAINIGYYRDWIKENAGI